MNIKTLMRYVWIAVLCCAASLPMHAQSATDGAIGGTVVDTADLAIPNATIKIRSNTTNAEQQTTSDASGFFRMVHLPPSTYTVTITVAGFHSYESKDVTVQVGLLTDISPKLTVGSTSEVVEVTSEAPALNSVSPDFANVIPQRTLQDLPGQQLSLVRPMQRSPPASQWTRADSAC